MKRYIIFCILFGMSHFMRSQDISLLHKQGTIVSTFINPAYPLAKTINIGLASINNEIGTDGPNLNKLTSKNPDGSRFLDKNKLKTEFETENNLFGQFELRTIDAGFKLGQWAVLGGHAFKLQGNFRYSEDLARLLFQGNSPFIGQTLSIGPSLDVMGYNELYLGAQKTIGALTIGGKIKLLYGTSNVYSESNKVSFTTDEEFYRWDFENDVTVRGSGTIRYNRLDSINFNAPDFSFDNFFFNNRGWAFDIGAVYHANDNLTLSVSLLDVGRIKWDFFPRKFQSQGKFTFDGFDLFEIIDASDTSLKDTLNQLFNVTQTLEEYTTSLNSSFTLGASYVKNKWSYHGLYQLRHNFGSYRNILSVSAVRQVGFIDLGAQMTASKNDFLNIGLYSNVNLKYVTFYVAVHNLVYGFDWIKSNSFSLRAGATAQF
jgi:hypothetical protein